MKGLIVEMDKVDKKIAEIRERAMEAERKELLEKAARMWPNDEKRRESWVFKKLTAKYGFRRNEEQVDFEDNIPPGPPSKGGDICVDDLPLENMTISFCIGDISGFGKGESLAEILKRNVGEKDC